MSLHQLLHILLARKWLMLATVVSTVAAAAAVTALLPPRYTASASIVVDFRTLDPVTGNVLPVALLPGYLATQLDIIASRNVALKAVDSLRLEEDPDEQRSFQEATGGNGALRDWLADSLLKRIQLDPSRESSMVNISFRDTDPRRAAAVVNAMVQAYIDTNVDLKVSPARQTTAFFNEQLQGLKEQLHAAQRKLSAFQREKGITASDERYDVENARLAELSTQVVGAQAQAVDGMSRRRQLERSLAAGATADVLPEVLGNPVIQALKGAVTQAESRLGDLSGRLGPGHPQYQAALAEVNEAKRKLADEMRVVAGSVNATSSIASQREGALRAALSEQRARVLEIKKQRDEAALFAREVENAQRAYDTAMTRFTQTRLESESNQTNIAVINPAIVPLVPSYPKMPLNLAFAFAAGVTLAIGLALIAEMQDRVVRCEEDILQVLNVPVLGRVLPGSARLGLRTAGLLPGESGPARLPQP